MQYGITTTVDAPFELALSATREALADQGFGVGGKRPRVAVEVFVGAKLQGIDEHAGDHEVGVLTGGFHQPQVPGVQVAHGRHQRNARAAGPCRSHRRTQGQHGVDRAQAHGAPKLCSGAGYRPDFTSAT